MPIFTPKYKNLFLQTSKDVGSYTRVSSLLSTQYYLTTLASNSGRNLELEDIYFKKLNRRSLARVAYHKEKKNRQILLITNPNSTNRWYGKIMPWFPNVPNTRTNLTKAIYSKQLNIASSFATDLWIGLILNYFKYNQQVFAMINFNRAVYKTMNIWVRLLNALSIDCETHHFKNKRPSILVHFYKGPWVVEQYAQINCTRLENFL